MAGFTFEKMNFGGVLQPIVVTAFSSADLRGGFTKCYEQAIFKENGLHFEPFETFWSVSRKNVLRGMHFQLRNPQAKLVSVPVGRVYDVIVDLRPDSSTLKKWAAVELSGENHRALYVPRGFAHGFLTMEENTVMIYQCEGAYDQETDTGIRFDDLDIGIEWPINSMEEVILSERDLGLTSFREYYGKCHKGFGGEAKDSMSD